MCAAVNTSPSTFRSQQVSSSSRTTSRDKSYDYLLKFLLVGDSDVGKEELLSGMDDGASESPYGYASSGIDYKTTTILLDGKRVKLQLWVTSGQGRFCTILRSYSRGAQGILLIYDITNKWSFDGIDRWIKEIDEHAPGVPKILVGNRLHLAFKRQISEACAEQYAEKNNMAFFEVSPLCDFNVTESFAELSRLALKRNGMSRAFGFNKVLSLQELACRTVVSCTTIYGIEQLPLPNSIKSHLKSYALTNKTRARMLSFVHRDRHKKQKYLNPCESPPMNCRKSCSIS
ncbi:ras-related protein Rab-40B [Biomphalaria glabrata]|uniref:small monomeric GTPase n=2 Tax=Biomphalaria TaxID=6525 RepID=A0A9U8EMI0_BIOGL|nr:ras-related protein Rab-40B-like [Biomphalaria glabrata]KAI8766148.1 ras-related protein Rab-40B-like [Biomphalaria glabrata]KAI8793923.1 ras-related protein Rab-40B [Biomphalaria glabrata]KAK0049146.1 ras-related protein Rab-40B [Biomphalaria pfeifferi]